MWKPLNHICVQTLEYSVLCLWLSEEGVDIREPGEDEEVEEYHDDFFCVACNKAFKSDKAWVIVMYYLTNTVTQSFVCCKYANIVAVSFVLLSQTSYILNSGAYNYVSPMPVAGRFY